MSLLVHKFSLFYCSLMSYKYVNISGAQGSDMSSEAAGWELGKISKLFLLSGMSSRTDIPQDPILKARRIWEFHP